MFGLFIIYCKKIQLAPMKKILLNFAFALVSIVMIGQVSTKEKQALLDLYIATNGEAWTNTWDINIPVSEWQGVTVKDNKVTGISLLFNNINGTIPSSIGDLEHLQVLELAFNGLKGTIPSSIGNLNQLEVLSFNGNFLIGEIPSSIGNLSKLQELHVSSNKLSGDLPNSIGALKNLVVLNVFDNDLTGIIPEGLVTSRSLRELVVAENNFTEMERFSEVMLRNSGTYLDLDKPILTPSAKTVIAIESSDDEN